MFCQIYDKHVTKACIAVLTRGYKTNKEYETLCKRNKSIEINLIDKEIDILIFHEGNITIEQQSYISNHTPLLHIIFIDISPIAFKKEKEQIKFSVETRGIPINYRHMCSFWFVDFWNVVKDYDFLLRIDEDCVMDCNIDTIFSQLHTYLFVAGHYENDQDFVTRGLNDFTRSFIEKNKHQYTFTETKPKQVAGPYTNVIGFSLIELRKNNILMKYIQEVDSSTLIYERRWGDLPIWGEVIYYICGTHTLLLDSYITYFHGSHHKQINTK